MIDEERVRIAEIRERAESHRDGPYIFADMLWLLDVVAKRDARIAKLEAVLERIAAEDASTNSREWARNR